MVDREESEQGRKKSDRRIADKKSGLKARPTIHQIIEWMEGEADLNFQGNLTDNVLKIFNMLPADEKRTFLRAGMLLLWERRIEAAKKGIEDIVIDSDMRIDPSAVVLELDGLDSRDRQEQLKLRAFILRFFLVISILITAAVSIWAWHHGSAFGDAEGLMKNINTIVEIILDTL